MCVKLLFIQSSLMHPGGASVAQRGLIMAAMSGGYKTSAISFDGKSYSPLGKNHFTREFIQNKDSRFSKIGFNKDITKYIVDVAEVVRPNFVIVGNVWGYFAVIEAIRQLKAKKALVVHGAENFCLNSMLTKMVDLSECDGQFGLKCISNRCEPPLRFPFKYTLHKYKNSILKKTYDCFIVHSEFMYNKLSQTFNKSIKYIPLCIDKEFVSAGSNIRENSILFVGTLTWNKGIIELIQAADLLHKEGVDFTINIVGAGVEKEKIQEDIKRLGLGHNVKMLGVLDREGVMREICSCELVVFPSYFESFGIVALEAMMLNKKLLMSNRGALNEIAKGYDNVYVLNEITGYDIAKQVKIALNKPVSRNIWKNPYTIENTLSKLESMINNL